VKCSNKEFRNCLNIQYTLILFLHDLYPHPHLSNIATNSWYNHSLQSYLLNVLSENKWSVTHNDAYFGESCIEFEADTKGYL